MAIMTMAALAAVSGCGESPNVETMKVGLARSGLTPEQAGCFAEKMAGDVNGETYNYMAKLMKEGASERDAVNKARRKYSADFKAPMEKARSACVQ